MSLSPPNSAELLSFWFSKAAQPKWYIADDGFDAQIRTNFEGLSIGLAAKPSLSFADPKTGLAIIIALDQFPRNMYRGTQAAFAWDDKALACAHMMIEKGWDLKLTQIERAFIYMPFMHAEDKTIQAKCVDLIDRRMDDANTLFHARAHQKLIEQFGRFPHRNAILGRISTPDEKEYLASGGYRP